MYTSQDIIAYITGKTTQVAVAVKVGVTDTVPMVATAVWAKSHAIEADKAKAAVAAYLASM